MIKKIKTHLQTLFSVSNTQLEEKIRATHNPYLEARLEWNHLFGDIRKAKYQWQWVTAIALFANLLLIVGIGVLAFQNKLMPYVVKVDQLGNALYAGFLDAEKTITPLEVNAFLRRYIVDARSVIADAFAEKKAVDFVYSVSLPSARKHLDDFYRASNPFVLAKQFLVEVQIQGVIQKSSHTWQVDWAEIHRGLEGQPLYQHHFEALLTIAHMTVQNQELLNTNPLGIYIQHISWAQQK
jgi:type IV secretion system protein TrbF